MQSVPGIFQDQIWLCQSHQICLKYEITIINFFSNIFLGISQHCIYVELMIKKWTLNQEILLKCEFQGFLDVKPGCCEDCCSLYLPSQHTISGARRPPCPSFQFDSRSVIFYQLRYYLYTSPLWVGHSVSRRSFELA